MNILITGAWNGAQQHIKQIEDLGHTVYFQQQEAEPLVCSYEIVEAIIGNGIFLSHPIERFTNLRYIQLTSAGFDRVPMDYVQEHGIKIYNARGVYSIPMAEFALAGVLLLYKQSRFFTVNQKAHQWEKHRGLLELNGKTVAIIGCGSVGTECASRFKAFNCRVLGIDPKPYQNSLYKAMRGLSELYEVLSVSDVVVLTLPLTEETKHMFNRERFVNMKQGAVLVNIARGGVVCTEDMIEALQAKQLGGVVLDVFEEEPLDSNNPLWDMENVVLTPHNSFVGEGNKDRLSDVILSNLRGDK